MAHHTPRTQDLPLTQFERRIRRYWLFLGWMLVLFVIYLSVTPTPIQLPGEGGDKFAHMLAYCVLMSWFANIYEVPGQRAMFAVGFVAMGIALEFVQRWTGYRTYEVADMVADAVGVAAGWIFAPPRMPVYVHMMEMFYRIRRRTVK